MNQYRGTANTDIRVRGHRGAALEPENTLKSFETAVELGVYSVEFDVRQCADGTPVVIHNETVDKTTDGSGPVSDYDVSDLQELDVGNDAHVPTLQETLDYFACTNVPEIRMEIKEQAAIDQAYELVDDKDMLDRIVFHSFDTDTLQDITRLDPDAWTSIVAMEPYDGLLDEAADLGCEIVTVKHENVTSDYIDAAHDRGFKTDIWGVNGEDAVRDAAAYNPTYIGSDDPQQVYDVLDM